VLAEVDDVVGPELAGTVDPAVDALDHDRLRAALVGDRDRVQAEAAGPLDDHAVAVADVDPVEAEQHLRQRAVGRGRDGRVEPLGDAVEVLVGVDEVVGRERAVEMGRLLGWLRPVAVGVLTQVELAPPAGGTPLAGDEVRRRDQVALRHRLARVVGLDARAEFAHPAEHLVAEHPLLHLRVVAPPDV
jgi:hypothetical protein